MSAPAPRGACPGLSAPMPTGDGLLVRLVPTEAMPVEAFIALCAAARRGGNGIMEVTARGSLQVRGLTPRSAPLFAAEVSWLRIAASDGVPVLANPLADDPDTILDSELLAAELRRALAHSQLALAPKVSVVIDGGGALHLDALSGDVKLRAVGPPEGSRWLVALQARPAAAPAPPERVGVASRGHSAGGEAADSIPHPPAEEGGGSTWLGAVAPERAIAVVLVTLRDIATLGPRARAADLLRIHGIDALRERFGIAPAAAPERRPPANMVGRHTLRDASLAIGVGLPFGHAEADALAELARHAAQYGARTIRPAPARVLMLIGVSPAHASNFAAVAADLGFIIDDDDPRRRISACPGAPACASGFIPARSLAAALAPGLTGLPDGIAIHVSGCAKGCAHPAPAALTVVGDSQRCGIVRNGTARATPCRHVSADDLVAEVARVFAPREAVH
ncbi:MAG: precorrin-3B synthase, partial [Xanthobacteraceae bacterium]|nr:precorrin-3B synthase [Xanthobacteraceae bacterium]